MLVPADSGPQYPGMTAKTGWRRSFGGWLGVCALVLTVLPVPRSSAWDFVYGDPGPSNYSRYQDVAMGPDGSAYVAGFFFGSFHGLSSTDTYSYFLQKLGPTGAVEWTRKLGGPALGPSSVPMPIAVTSDGLGNVVAATVLAQLSMHLESWSQSGLLLGTRNDALALPPTRAATGGFIISRNSTDMPPRMIVERVAPDLSVLWSQDLSDFYDFNGAFPVEVAETDDGSIWAVGAKRRTVITGNDAMTMVRLSPAGELVTSIKRFGLVPGPQFWTALAGGRTLFSAVDGFIWIHTPTSLDDAFNAGVPSSIRSFSTVDGSELGVMSTELPNTPVSSSVGPRNCGRIPMYFARTGNSVGGGALEMALTMNGTRFLVLASCGTNGAEGPPYRTFLLTYSVPNPSGAGMTLLSAKEMSSTSNIVAMDANAYGDVVVVGSTSDGQVYIGQPARLAGGRRGAPSSEVTAQAVVERAVAAKNPSGSLNFGIRKANTVMELKVVGRNGVPLDAQAVSLNVTSTGTTKAGYLTVYPCGGAVPPTSSLNFTAGKTRSNAVISEIGVGGKVCVFASADTHVVIDVGGYFPKGSRYAPLAPARILESRPFAATTVDGQYWKIGERVANSVTELAVTGRAGVPADAVAAVLSVTAVGPKGSGAMKVYPCGTAVPGPSHLPLALSQTVATTVISALGSGGKVCFLPSVATNLVVDVQGYFAAGSGFVPVKAAKLADTSTAATAAPTVDGQYAKLGRRLANSTTAIAVAGRGGIAASAESVSLKITVSGPTANGYLNVYPCGRPVPFTAMLTYTTGATVTNTVLAKVGDLGSVCVYTSAPVNFVLDGHGYFSPGGASLLAQSPERVVDTRSR